MLLTPYRKRRHYSTGFILTNQALHWVKAPKNEGNLYLNSEKLVQLFCDLDTKLVRTFIEYAKQKDISSNVIACYY